MSTPVDRAVFARRWERLEAAYERHGLEGAVVVSRGGAQTDSYADVLYLSGHYNVFPLLPEAPPHWSGHSHAALVFGGGAEPTLVVGFGEVREDLVGVRDVRVAPDLPKGIASALAERGLAGRPVGFAGANTMLAGPYRRLCELVGAEHLIHIDTDVEALRVPKEPGELDRLRASARAGEAVMRAILKTAARGRCTEADAVGAGSAVAAAEGIAMYDAAVASGSHSTRYTYGRLPSWSQRPLDSGDVFHVDLYGALDGYLFDFSRTVVVGRPPDAAQRSVLDGAAAAIDAGVRALARGRTGRDLFAVVRNALVADGLAEPAGSGGDGFAGYDCHGHGLGTFWEWPWLTPWEERTVQESTVVCVECMAGRPDVGLVKLEQVSIVGATGVEPLLTLPAVVTGDDL